jgi:8-oxo-dGTP diphosphatase
MGWQGFTELARLAHMPVYALGGMTPDDLPHARSCGAQGIAGIRAFLPPI